MKSHLGLTGRVVTRWRGVEDGYKYRIAGVYRPLSQVYGLVYCTVRFVCRPILAWIDRFILLSSVYVLGVDE